jgi:hypothetical protein
MHCYLEVNTKLISSKRLKVMALGVEIEQGTETTVFIKCFLK